MSRRLLASLLLCVGLLTQALAPAFKAGAEAVNCRERHAGRTIAASDVVAPDRSRQSPAPDGAAHDHGSCSLCQFGWSEAPLATWPASAAILTFGWSRISFVSEVAPFAPSRLNPGAPARAPPSLA